VSAIVIGSVAEEVVDLLGVGRTTDAVELAERELHRRGSVRDPRLVEAWAAASLAAGRHCVDVRQAVGGAYYDHAACGDAAGAGMAATARGRLELAAGRAGSAARWMQRAIRVLDAGGDEVAGARRAAHAVRAQAEALLGYDVRPTVDRLVAAADGWDVAPTERVDVLLAGAWGAAANGEPVVGSELLLGAVRDCGGRIADEAVVLHGALRLGAPPARVAERLTELAGAIDGPVIALVAQRAEALAADDGLLLDMTASGFEALGLDLLAAETWGEATSAYRRRGGRTSSAALTLSNARMALARCEGATTPVIEATVQARLRPEATAIRPGERSSRSRCAAR
jgi:hypothetical protein